MQNIGNRKASQENYLIMLNAVAKGVKEVEVLDAMCGTGKTYNLFKFISDNPAERYLYVTPMLSEVSSRPAEELAKFGDRGIIFCEPTGEGFKTKGDHLLELLKDGQNIICTHSLFQLLEESGRDSVRKYGYIIIIDEELGMIEPLRKDVLATEDAKPLVQKGSITIEKDGQVVWKDANWGVGSSAFAQARKMADAGSLYANKNGTFFNVQLPTELIRAAKRVIVATYLFEGSIFHAFLKVKGVEYKPFAFDGMELRDEHAAKAALLNRIEFVDAPAARDRLYRRLRLPMDDLAARVTNGALSHSWYASASQDKLTEVGNHIRNIARQMEVRANDLIYTLPSSAVGKRGNRWIKRGRLVKVKSYGPETCYLHKGARATNDYAERTAAIHAYNRYLHPAIKTYLEDHGAKISDDTFALAEMIQWLFRTAIRKPDQSKIKLHIVSPRMQKIFLDWLHS
jgi:hypothetical protein